jgi:hypothetical protein
MEVATVDRESGEIVKRRFVASPRPIVSRQQGGSDWWFIAALLLLLLVFGALRWESFLKRHFDYELFSPKTSHEFVTLVLSVAVLLVAALVIRRLLTRKRGFRKPSEKPKG